MPVEMNRSFSGDGDIGRDLGVEGGKPAPKL
jgi:hypothetical protein